MNNSLSQLSEQEKLAARMSWLEAQPVGRRSTLVADTTTEESIKRGVTSMRFLASDFRAIKPQPLPSQRPVVEQV